MIGTPDSYGMLQEDRAPALVGPVRKHFVTRNRELLGIAKVIVFRDDASIIQEFDLSYKTFLLRSSLKICIR